MSHFSRRSILFLNRSYWPDVEATGQLLTELCEGLAQHFDVAVMAGQPNSVRGLEESSWKDQPVHNEVLIHRLRHSTLPKHRMWMKALNYVSFVRSARRFLKKIERPDVVVFETDPFLLPIEADRLRRRTGCRVVGYLQDIYPDVAVTLGKIPNVWPIRQLRKRLFDVYRRCDAMVVLSQDMKQLLVESGISPERIAIVPNWTDPARVYPVPQDQNAFRIRNGLGEKFVVMYSGNLGLTQRLEDVLQAAKLLADEPRIHFAFVGKGSQEMPLKKLAEEVGLRNLSFFDYQPQSELAHSLSSADLHLVPLTAGLAKCLMPSKLYGILAAGRPCLTNAPPETELHQLVNQHRIGFTVPPGSVADLATQIRKAATDIPALKAMGHRARQLAETEFTRDLSIQKFRIVLENVLAADRREEG